MGVDGIGEVGEGQAALARKGARGGKRRTGNKVSSNKELTEVGRMMEGDRGGTGKKVASGGVR